MKKNYLTSIVILLTCFIWQANAQTPPTITCPGDISVSNDSGLCSAVVVFADATATEPDGDPITITQTGGLPSGSAFPVGVSIIEFTATDIDGSDICTFTITVADTEDPTWTVPPADLTVECDGSGNTADFSAWLASFSGADNCGTATVTDNSTGLSNDCGATGFETVTFTLTDECGLFITLDATFTIEDTTDPLIVCPADVIANNDPGICGATVVFPDAISIDTCGTVSVVQSAGDPSGTIFPVGVSTVEYTATDECGNISICSFTITIIDNEPPTIICPADITVDNDLGICGAIVNYPDPMVMDNCFTGGPTTGTSTAVYSGAPVSWTDGTTGLVVDIATDAIVVPAGATIIDVNVSLDIDHSWIGDLDITLTSPDGTSVLVLDSSCGSQDNISATFDDAGGPIGCGASSTPGPHEACPGNFGTSTVSGIVMPSNPLAVMNGGPADGGSGWVLTIVDNVGGDGGCISAPGFSVDVGWMAPAGVPYTVITGFPSGDVFPVGTTLTTLEFVDVGGN
ncbi:MAG: HYR domain-containing protein, partial [Bacteroidetes bacterium]|nr:HYR domain-containing protein [Bacteroidota bacterium]